jgi:hypothetical protein
MLIARGVLKRFKTFKNKIRVLGIGLIVTGEIRKYL